ncbi:MFS transporter [Erythrobacter sp. MTPC3]|uniref:MFS transporter n=1 Tax=Erythrobacter sp. MTPC3 TaxID=3056564 RepID=UPI0036F34CD8
MTGSAAPDDRQPFWFLALLALAVGGGAVAYVPLLTVLLPLKITGLIGAQDVPALARVTFFGAIIASIANIAFGMVSDRTRTRVPWIVTGLIISSALLVAIGRAQSVEMLIVLVMAWQIGLNMMLAPLLAWAGDCVPDSQKGLLGGLFAIAPALGGMAGSLVTFEMLVATEYRLPTNVVLVALLVLPVVIFGRGKEREELMRPVAAKALSTDQKAASRSAVSKMWIARFLVQISEAGLFAFLLFWLRSIVPDFHENTAANIFSAVLIVSVPLTLLLGRWSDRVQRPLAPLVASAAFAGVGLSAMAGAADLPLAIVGYVLFGISASVFLSLHSSQTLRVLPLPQHRGRDLGIFNLTNTVPSIVMPWLTLTLVPGFGFSALFVLFACFAGLAAILLATVSRRA